MKNNQNTVKCYHNHKGLTLKEGMGTLYGGNGYNPCVKADLYIDLNPRDLNSGIPAMVPLMTQCGNSYLNLPIKNMGVPTVKNFLKVLNCIIDALNNGQDVHVGCIGGHGRTGLMLAAVVCRVTGNVDAINWVRANYCHKAVESQAQADYLNKHLGIAPMVITKYKV